MAAVITDGALVLAARRRAGKSSAGLWEFPGGKVDPGEDPRSALRREIVEELDVRILVGALLGDDESVVGGIRIRLMCFAAMLAGPRPAASTDHDVLRWLDRAALAEIDWSAADLPMVARLRATAR